ncbi:MAG: hypothetical protein JRC66_07875 [Deltaproteobacteria bacterium]|nr:hypothetical protein [Deltaproteobacteria bacterium]
MKLKNGTDTHKQMRRRFLAVVAIVQHTNSVTAAGHRREKMKISRLHCVFSVPAYVRFRGRRRWWSISDFQALLPDSSKNNRVKTELLDRPFFDIFGKTVLFRVLFSAL